MRGVSACLWDWVHLPATATVTTAGPVFCASSRVPRHLCRHTVLKFRSFSMLRALFSGMFVDQRAKAMPVCASPAELHMRCTSFAVSREVHSAKIIIVTNRKTWECF